LLSRNVSWFVGGYVMMTSHFHALCLLTNSALIES
jgi:hypothetical protein